MTKEEKIKRFDDLLLSTKRPGIEKLLEFLHNSDFYIAPASTKYHSCHEGGLLEHSLNVYDCLEAKRSSLVWESFLKDTKEETIILVSLLHDLGKCYMYTVEMRNKKNERGEWEKVPYYAINDKYPLPHSTKALVFIAQFINLTMEEIMAIAAHMGFSEPKENYNAVGGAFKKYPLALAMHEADLEATDLYEDEN